MFGSIFSEGSGFNIFVGRIVDVIWLNILTVICCLPIVTIGTSLTAMYSVLFKMIEDKEGYISKDFFRAFKENFKKTSIVWLIILTLLFITRYEMRVVDKIEELKSFAIIFHVVMVLILLGFTYVFPLMARYENTIKNTIKNAYIYVGLCLPQTLLIIAVTYIPAYLVYRVMNFYFVIVSFGVASIGYMNSKIFLHIFKKYEKKPR